MPKKTLHSYFFKAGKSSVSAVEGTPARSSPSSPSNTTDSSGNGGLESNGKPAASSTPPPGRYQPTGSNSPVRVNLTSPYKPSAACRNNGAATTPSRPTDGTPARSSPSSPSKTTDSSGNGGLKSNGKPAASSTSPPGQYQPTGSNSPVRVNLTSPYKPSAAGRNTGAAMTPSRPTDGTEANPSPSRSRLSTAGGNECSGHTGRNNLSPVPSLDVRIEATEATSRQSGSKALAPKNLSPPPQQHAVDRHKNPVDSALIDASSPNKPAETAESLSPSRYPEVTGKKADLGHGGSSAERNGGKKGLKRRRSGTNKEKQPKIVLQRFSTKWTSTPELKCFQEYKQDPHYAYCTICLDKLSVARGGKSNLTTHLATKAHQEAAAKAAADPTEPTTVEECSGRDKVAEAELKLCSWALENNISFAAVDKLVETLKSLQLDSKDLHKLKLGRTKVTAFIDGVIAEIQHDELVQLMREFDFSIIIDESTDLANKKTLVIVVRFTDEESFRARDVFYASVEVEMGDHVSLHQMIVDQFKKDGIDYRSRMKGFGSDGVNVLQGKHNSVRRLFEKECPGLISVKCTCHSLALCASYACEKLPSYLEQLCRDVYNYISSSPKRACEFERIQDILEVKPLKILHPSATRWLSLEAVVKRNLERFEELKLFFNFQSSVDQNPTAKRILAHLTDPMTLPLLHFLDYVIPLVNKVNRQFQAEESQFCELYHETKSLLMLLLGNLCGDNAVKSFAAGRSEVADVFESLIKPPHEIHIGLAAEEAAGHLNDDLNRKFRTMCKDFYVELIKQILKRFDLNDPIVKNASIMNPSRFIQQQNVTEVLKSFPDFIDKSKWQEMDTEFRTLKNSVLCLDQGQHPEKDLTWPKLLNVKRRDGSFLYPVLRSFVSRFLLIPHSSACVERIFSLFNANKTKQRNRLSTSTMESILRGKQYVCDNGGSAQIKLTKKMKMKIRAKMYKHHSKSNE